MSHVFHRPEFRGPRAVGGDGCYLIDASGKRYLDASGGAAVSCLGHNHPRIVQAVRDQAGRLAYAHTAFFTTEPMETLADRLIQEAPAGIDKAYFVSSGSEAIEASLKLARQYFLATGHPDRRAFIARRQSYHGNTLGALAVGGNARRRAPYAPLLMDVHHIPPCYAYRDRLAGETDEAYGRRVADALESAILEIGPSRVIGFVAETVVGATLGAVPPVAGYFRRIRDICDRYGVLLILDEVMCGMGRTGTLHACEQEGVAPDIMTIAKGLGGGYQPIGAMLVSGRIAEAVQSAGGFQHGHTYVGHAIGCATALAVQDVIRDEHLLRAVQERGTDLCAALRARFSDHPYVGDIRGRGLLLAVELVADRSSKDTFDPALALHARVKREAMDRGLICYPMGGTIDGVRGDHVLIAPPYIVTRDQIVELVDKLSASIDAAIASAV